MIVSTSLSLNMGSERVVESDGTYVHVAFVAVVHARHAVVAMVHMSVIHL